MYNELGIREEVVKIVNDSDKELKSIFSEIDELCDYNSLRVLSSFHKHEVSEACFNSTTGYGYNDLGRDTIEKIFADIFGCEDALVRSQFISGSHALTVCLFGLLRPGDTLLSICGKPYDTLDEVIGIVPNNSSLQSFGVKYDQIDLLDNDFDYEKIKEFITNYKVKVIEIQRSKGYSTRKSLTIDKVEKVVKFIKEIDSNKSLGLNNANNVTDKA